MQIVFEVRQDDWAKGVQRQCVKQSGDVNELPVMEMSCVVCCGSPPEKDPKQTTTGKCSLVVCGQLPRMEVIEEWMVRREC